MRNFRAKNQPCKDSHQQGFTLIELLVAVVIMTSTTLWTLPKLNHKIKQGHVDRYTQNLETGLFNLMARVRRSSKYCTLFEQNQSLSTYHSPKNLLELNNLDDRSSLINCPCTSGSNNCNKPFRFLQKENTQEANLVQVRVSKTNFGLSPQGTNPNGEKLTIRIRSNDWQQNKNVFTRCIEVSGTGHLHKGTWNYSNDGNEAIACAKNCPVDGNCNG